MADTNSIEQLMAEIVVRNVAAGKPVEIEGLGAFHPDPANGIRFEPQLSPTVFIAHVQEDSDAAARIYDALERAGCSPWMDQKKLTPGQNWPRAIENTIETSGFFIFLILLWMGRFASSRL